VETGDGFHLHWHRLCPLLWCCICRLLCRSTDVRAASSFRKRGFSHQRQRDNQGWLHGYLQVQPWLPNRRNYASHLPAVEQWGYLAARRPTSRLHKAVNSSNTIYKYNPQIRSIKYDLTNTIYQIRSNKYDPNMIQIRPTSHMHKAVNSEKVPNFQNPNLTHYIVCKRQ